MNKALQSMRALRRLGFEETEKDSQGFLKGKE